MKERIRFLITLFTRIVTGILIFDTLILLIIQGKNTKLSLVDLLCILLIGFLDTLLYLPFTADKDFSKTQWIVMNIFYFIGINVTTLFFGYLLCWFSFKNPASLLVLESVIICTYSLVMFFFYKVDVNTAQKMNEKLKELDE